MVNETYMTHLQNIADEYSPDTRQCILDFVEKHKYTNKKLDLVAINDFEEKGKSDPFYAKLHEIIAKNNMLWCKEAEDYLLAHAPEI